MNDLVGMIFVLLVAFFIAVIIAVPIINFIKSKKVNQPIYEYVEKHNLKAGTPTMGGLVFIITFILVSIFFINGFVKHIYSAILFALLNACVGIYDDILKIKNKKNLGLKPYQKIIFQLILTLGFGIYLYLNSLTILVLPFSKIAINFKFWIIPIAILIGIFFINSVNLTDGLDGLVCFITLMVTGCLVAILWLISASTVFESANFVTYYGNFVKILSIFFGAILGYIFYNCFPAKIFMGDTGSLFIGSILFAISMLTGTLMFLLVFGIMYLVSGVSVILQVAYYKLKKKRIFLMAPLHHHFELKGIHENRITVWYGGLTLIVSLLVIAVEMIIVL